MQTIQFEYLSILELLNYPSKKKNSLHRRKTEVKIFVFYVGIDGILFENFAFINAIRKNILQKNIPMK